MRFWGRARRLVDGLTARPGLCLAAAVALVLLSPGGRAACVLNLALVGWQAALRGPIDQLGIAGGALAGRQESSPPSLVPALLGEAARLDPADPRVRHHLALASLSGDNWLLAAEQARLAAAAGAAAADTALAIGSAWWRSGRQLDALEVWRQEPRVGILLARIGTVEASRADVAAFPGSSAAHFGLGCVLAAAGDRSGAAAAFREAIRLDHPARGSGDGEAAGPYSRADAFYRLGLLAYEGGHYEESRGLFEQALEVDPVHFWALELVALADYRRSGDATRARGRLEAVVARYPHHVNAMQDIAQIALGAGDVRDARLWVDRALRLAPASGEIRLVRGRILLAQGDPEAALADFERAMTTPSLTAGTRTWAARAALAAGRLDQAEAYAGAALRAAPDPDAWDIAGDIRRARGDPEGAARAWGEALALAPARADIRAKLEALKR